MAQTRPDEGLPPAAQVEFETSVGALPTTVVRSHANADYDASQNVDVSLARFFANPVTYSVIAWPTAASTTVSTVVPAGAYLDGTNFPALFYRLRYYRHMRATTVVTITTNSTPHHYGRMFFQLVPWQYSAATNPTQQGILSGDNGAFLDASTANTVTLKLPFSAPFDWFNTRSVGAEINFLGVLRYTCLQHLKRDDGGTAAGPTFSISVSLEDFHCKGPTDAVVATLSEESKSKSGPISGPLRLISNLSQRARSLPFVGKYADVTKSVTGSLSDIASALGYGKPVEPIGSSSGVMLNAPLGNLANVNVPLQGTSLSLYSDTASVTSGEYLGSVPDTLSWDYLIRRWGYLGTSSFPQAGLALDHIITIPVTPLLSYRTSATEHTFTPISLHAMRYRYWTGDLDFRFMVAATPYIKARIAIVYFPNVSATGPGVISHGELAAYPHCILDIENEVDKVVTIRWSQGSMALVLDDILSYIGQTDATGNNGYLSLYIIDPIQASVITGVDLGINIFVRAGREFRFYHPTDNRMMEATVATGVTQNFRLRDVNSEPEASCSLGDGINIADVDIRMREPVLSPRVVLQRPQLWGVFANTTTLTTTVTGDEVTEFFVLPHVPSAGSGNYFTMHTATTDIKNYYLTRITYLSTLLQCFVGYRGSTTLTIPPVSRTRQGMATMTAVTREFPSLSVFQDDNDFEATVYGPEIMGYWTTTPDSFTDNTSRGYFVPATRFALTGLAATMSSTQDVPNSLVCSAPYDCPHRYSCQGRTRARNANPGYRLIVTTTVDKTNTISGNGSNAAKIEALYSIGDDFQLYFYTCSPTIYASASGFAPTIKAFPTT